jgi:hypothetical protein
MEICGITVMWRGCQMLRVPAKAATHANGRILGSPAVDGRGVKDISVS